MTQTLGQLENRDAFIERHIGPDARQQQEMLKTVGADSLNALIGQIVPQDIQLATPPQVGEATTEFAALAELKAIAGRNKRFKSYIGMGYTAVQLPPVILRNMLENPGWYTAYTPYQPEVSQGRLESLLNFQQVVMDLTGMELANASLLDEATAAAEAMALCKRGNKKSKSNTFFVAEDVFPQTLDVIKTRAEFFGFELKIAPVEQLTDEEVFGALVQYPSASGNITDLAPLLAGIGIPDAAAATVALVVMTLIIAYLSLVLGELVDGLGERVQVDDDEVERCDAELTQLRQVVVLARVGEDARVHLGVQRLDATLEALGETGQLLDGRHRDAETGDELARTTGRDDLDAGVGEGACQLLQTRLVVHRDEGPLDGAQTVTH